jgi:hypothetical protein
LIFERAIYPAFKWNPGLGGWEVVGNRQLLCFFKAWINWSIDSVTCVDRLGGLWPFGCFSKEPPRSLCCHDWVQLIRKYAAPAENQAVLVKLDYPLFRLVSDPKHLRQCTPLSERRHPERGNQVARLRRRFLLESSGHRTCHRNRDWLEFVHKVPVVTTANLKFRAKKNLLFEVKLFMGGFWNSDRQPFCVTKSGGGKHCRVEWEQCLAQLLRQYFHRT